MMPEMEMVKDAALKYDKPTLGRMAQMGQISPTVAVMAGMMRDRIVQSEMKPPAPPTVAEEIMQPMGQRMGLGAIAPQQPPQAQGIDQIPVPDRMFEPQGMAGGGVVAFDNGGMPIERLLQMMNGMERAEYQRTGKVPERLQKFLPKTDVESRKFARQDSGVPMSSEGVGLGSLMASPPPPPRDGTNLPSTAQAAIQAANKPAETPLGLEQQFAQDYAMIQRILGEDPTRQKLKELYEKQERESEEGSRKDQAMRIIEAGLGVAGGTSPYFAANLAGALPGLRGYGEDVRARRKEATERAKGMAELEGMTRKEKADILSRTMAELREEKKTKEDREFRKELVRLQASLKPEDFNRYAARMLEKGTPAQKAAIREVLGADKRSSTGQLTASQMANIRAKAIKNAQDKIIMDPRYIKAKTPQDKQAVQKIIEREELEKLLPEYEAGTSLEGWGDLNISGGK